MLPRPKAKVRKPISDEAMQGLIRMFVDYRRTCPMGGAAALQAAVRKVAERHGTTFAELWGDVHRLAHEAMNAGQA